MVWLLPCMRQGNPAAAASLSPGTLMHVRLMLLDVPQAVQFVRYIQSDHISVPEDESERK